MMPPRTVLPAAHIRAQRYREREERIVASARVILAAAALLALVLDPAEPVPGLGRVVAVTLIAFAVYATYLALLAALNPAKAARLGVFLHATDLGWAVAVTSVTAGAGSAFFVFFIFVLVSASYRWGLRESLMTGCVATLLLLTEAVLQYFGVWLFEPALQVNHLVMRVVYLVGLGALVGYLAEEQKLLRREAAVIADALAGVQTSGSFRAGLESVLRLLASLFEPRDTIVIFEEQASGRTYTWRRGEGARGVSVEVTQSAAVSTLVPRGGSVAALRLERSRRGTTVLAVDAAGERTDARVPELAIQERFKAERVLVAARVDAPPDWRGELVLVDPRQASARALRLVARVAAEVGPALYSIYLVRRLRSRATAAERARVARELHDGLIQSLLGVEMEVSVLAAQAEARGSTLAANLARIRGILHDQALTTRDLMHQLRPIDLSKRRVTEYLSEVVERFHRETGINAKFLSESDEASVPEQIGREIVRIVQEALVNVRKHSGASAVVVRFEAARAGWSLMVNDNGAGFPFDGRFDIDDLDAMRRGPLVIKERVRMLNGTLVVESTPGRGASVQVSIPQPTYA